MSASGNPHAAEHDLMVRKGVLEQKLEGLRRQYAATSTELRALKKEAESLYGTSDPVELKRIAEKNEKDYNEWLQKTDEVVSKNEALVSNVLNNLEKLSQEA